MAQSNVTTRLVALLFVIQFVIIGATYFLRLEGPLMNVPFVRAEIEAVRAKANLDAMWTRFTPEQKVWGYADRHSIAPGEPFNIMLSIRPGDKDVTAGVTIYRIGWKDGAPNREWVWAGDKDQVRAQDFTNTAASIGAGWTSSYAVADTANWKSGYYAIDADYADGKHDENVAFIVVRPQKRTGDVLVKISTNTFQAYNRWGGHSYYNSALFGDKAPMISFDRPTYPGFEDYETWFVSWMDRYAQGTGADVAYISDFDLHRDAALMDGYKLFVSQGHDEYWTKEMFDAVENRIFKQGRNAVFLGANTAYWQVRYADLNQAPGGENRGRQMISYKEKPDPIVARFPDEQKAMPYVTNMFRWNSRRPETMLLGVGYQNYFEPTEPSPQFDYKIVDAGLPFFEGTGWKAGDTIKGVVGYEWDNRDPDGDGKRLWDPMLSMNAEIPLKNIRVLFTGDPVDIDGKKGRAEAVYWESPAGAKVFASGAIRWDWGFGRPGYSTPAFLTFSRNLFDHFRK